MNTGSWGFDSFFIIIFCGILVWILYSYIKKQPEMLSKENLSKSFYTMGLLALGLIAFVAFGVFVLRM